MIKIQNLAHITKDHTRTQPLEEHLRTVAEWAADFAAIIGESACASMLGALHDLGKYPGGWQNYLRKSSGYDPAIPSELCERGSHSSAGAVYLLEKLQKPYSYFCSYVIAGHHAGLPDFYGSYSGESMTSRFFDDQRIKTEWLDGIDMSTALIHDLSGPSSFITNMDNEYKHLWVRFLFSCLVDADWLDTERFMSPHDAASRVSRSSLVELKTKFDTFMQGKCSGAPVSKINGMRSAILNQCIAAGALPPGFFSLTVPTGGGKTLSAMAFALKHAVQYNKDRIITVIPFTSIIEQTAKTYKYGTDDDEKIHKMREAGKSLFGEENVLEHHSNVDPEKQLYMNMLAAQNWDAPIVVTTNVQLFESLLAAKPSVCRKLHNIANSVIILDEAQKIPAEYLAPIISVLKGLVKYFKVTVLFCTATQPALTGEIGSAQNQIEGISGCREIINDPAELFGGLKRVHYSIYKNDINVRSSWQEIADELFKVPQVLCVVNKRKDCRELMRYMPEGTIQLSGLMCGAELSELVSKIKKLLREEKPIRVVSTQLVEAGVDIDFPEVWRALAQLDSIVQAAGRANREGKLPFGKVVVFNPESDPFGEILIGAQITKINAGKPDYFNNLSSSSFDKYFRRFYAEHLTLDKCHYEELLIKEACNGRFNFRSFADAFKIIDDKNQKTILVPYKEGRDLIGQLYAGSSDRKLMTKLQRYSVNIPIYLFNKMQQDKLIVAAGNYYVLMEGCYKPGKGVLMDEFFSYDDKNFMY